MEVIRPLYSNEFAKHFVKGILEIESPENIREAIGKIVSAELQLQGIESKTTMLHSAYRSYGFENEESRQMLRANIFKELISLKRLDSDDDIKMGVGGALPLKGEVQDGKQAYIITGLPAAGKSGITNIISDNKGAIILDSDYAKRKFPEFTQPFGATLVHEESVSVVFGGKHSGNDSILLEYCMYKGYNVVIPKIGYNAKSIIGIANQFKKSGYDVHLLLVSLDRKKATQRAFKRFITTNRYVPLSMIFDSYGNDPILSYYRMKGESCFFHMERYQQMLN